MSTLDFGTMQARIRNELNRGTEYDPQIRKAIVSAIQHYKGKRFTWNVKRAYTTTSAGQEYYEMPLDFIEADSIRILYNSGDFTSPMDEVTYRWIEAHRTNVNYRSEPQYFALQNQELRLYPVPDDAYQILMTYLYEDTSVSHSAADSTTSDWLSEGEELVRLRAKTDLLENYIRGQEAPLLRRSRTTWCQT